MCYKNIKILYEDKELIVLDKPSDLVVHPGAGQKNETLVDFLKKKYKNNLSDISGKDRPGIVHRLDKDTSGLLIIAKNNNIHKLLQSQFKKREINRLYYAVVWGLLNKNNGTFNMNIGRNPKNSQSVQIPEKKAIRWKMSKTFFKRLNKNFTENKISDNH